MEAVRRWREDWRYPTALLCIYGFFSTVKPMEAFIILYMTGPDKNLTIEEVNNQIFPVWTYSYLTVLVPVFLLTDWLRYKPVLVFQCVALFVTTAMILWLTGVPAMQAMQFFYGVVTASEVAYFSYIYSVVDFKHYRKATSYVRSVQLMGYTVGSVLGQLLFSFDLLSYNNTIVLTLVLIAVALLVSCLLPMPQRSMFFHRRSTRQKIATEGTMRNVDGTTEHTFRAKVSVEKARDEKVEKGETEDEARPGLDEKGPPAEDPEESVGAERCSKVLLQLWRDFCQCYSSRQMLYWSVWWAMATCGYNQTTNYVQVLWEHVQPAQNISVYNGGVEAMSNLFGAATAYGIGFTEVRWDKWGELALGGFSGFEAAALFLMTFAGNIWVCYTGYVIFKCLHMMLITIAMYQIATDLSMERYALVFGANTFGALVLQTIMTSIVVDSGGLGLDVIAQFTINASYVSLIAVVYSLRGMFTLWRLQRSNKSHESTAPVKKEPPDSDEHRF
ncbi:thiamine transporter 1 [Clinocottus analis]|uniref:thiamine transporter 1 n=1 Tax=Clinocottus analis TaxID=304258 RepID=UPI0035C18FA6